MIAARSRMGEDIIKKENERIEIVANEFLLPDQKKKKNTEGDRSSQFVNCQQRQLFLVIQSIAFCFFEKKVPGSCIEDYHAQILS